MLKEIKKCLKGREKAKSLMRKILSNYLYYHMPLFFCASSLEEDT